VNRMPRAPDSSGFTLIEVLVTLVIVAIGLLGLAGLQMSSLNNQLEAYQRAQAMLLLHDMANRIQVNSASARSGGYADASDYGLRTIANCAAINVASSADAVTRDICEWNSALAGTGAKLGTKNLGSLVGARACIQNLAGSAFGEKIVRLTVAWMGTSATKAPSSTCGKDAFGADKDDYRRTATIDVTLGILSV
jgi:type IV pilus assembly protein PilV